MSVETPDLVVVGAASRDLTDRDKRGWRLGGSATYCSLAAARLGLRVACLVGVDALAADADELELLRLAGVRLRPVALEHGPVFENIEEDGHRHQRWRSQSDAIPVAALPDEWRLAGGWLLVPVAGELPDDWAAAVPRDARVGLGWQGLLRDFGADGWMERKAPAASPLARRAGLACASVDDLPSGFDVGELRRLASTATIVVTAGAHGGLVLQGAGLNRYAALAAGGVEDPTGAGDVFMAALMVAWLTSGELATPRSLLFAAAAGSLVVEGVGLAGVATREAVESRMDDRP
ncbi:MAG: PfkB family carbohydrate kinase, partial [Candidatus Limnocylindrales bacterium]